MLHLGTKVSALLDGRLAADEEERCWSHVQLCHACRDLVEREAWVKSRLAGLSTTATGAPSSLRASLAFETPEMLPEMVPDSLCSVPSRQRTVLAIGGGAVGVAVVGVLALGTLGAPTAPQTPPVTDLTRPTVNPSISPTVGPIARSRASRSIETPARTRMVSARSTREKMGP